MKNYTITVNGNVYEVTVEEGFTGAAKAAPAPAPKAAPAPRAAAPAPAPAAPAPEMCIRDSAITWMVQAG